MHFKRKSYNPPHFAHLFTQYDRKALAQSLGITKQYLCNVLAGFYKPSQELENKILALAATLNMEATNND